MTTVNIEGVRWARGHYPIVSFKIVRNIPRPPAELVESFRNYDVPDISDLVGYLYTMDSTIRPLYHPIKRLLGSALTVKIPPGDNTALFKAMRMVEPGDVLVVDARGYTECSGSGAASLKLPISRGLVGVVIDGAWRDVTELQSVDFPIYGKAISPFSGPKLRPGEVNVPVCCGGVIVHPGDIVVCDEEGGVVIPQSYAQKVADELKKQQQRIETDLTEERPPAPSDAFSEWFDGLMQVRGGTYVDWPDT